jgi:CSLREA domain-containing protein
MGRLGSALGCAGIALAVLAPCAGAATITVDIPQDDDQGVDEIGCSLREAVQSANTNTAVSLCDATTTGAFTAAPDTILLQGGRTHVLTKDNASGGEDDNVSGDIDIEGPVTITATGTGLATIDQDDDNFSAGTTNFEVKDRVFHVEANAGAVTFNRLRITGGVAGNGGPVFGIPTLGGGGILTESALTITDSEIAGNIAREYNSNFSAMGGGIMVRGGLARLTMTGSTVADNIVETADDFLGGSAIGGGIAAFPVTGGQTPPQGVDITNSTISGNTAAAVGTPAGNFVGVIGGIFGANGPAPGNNKTTVNLTNVTVTSNQATAVTPANGAVGGVQVAQGTTTGSVIAGNTDADTASSLDDCGLGNTSGGGNLIGRPASTGACAYASANDLTGTSATPLNPNLGNLLLNGGLTRTHAPNPGSPALDRGGSCPATDQTGLFRYIAAPCDAGALEIGATATPPPAPPAAPQPTVTPPGPTGQRAAALAKCQKKAKKKRKKCRAAANKLPV